MSGLPGPWMEEEMTPSERAPSEAQEEAAVSAFWDTIHRWFLGMDETMKQSLDAALGAALQAAFEVAPPADGTRKAAIWEAATWVLNCIHGVGKAGAKPEPGEYEAAADALKAAIDAAPAPSADGLRAALEDAAKSLETIGEKAGRIELLEDLVDVRGYAVSRARVARNALAAAPVAVPAESPKRKYPDWPFTEISEVPHRGCGGRVRYYVSGDHEDVHHYCEKCRKDWWVDGPDA